MSEKLNIEKLTSRSQSELIELLTEIIDEVEDGDFYYAIKYDGDPHSNHCGDEENYYDCMALGDIFAKYIVRRLNTGFDD